MPIYAATHYKDLNESLARIEQQNKDLKATLVDLQTSGYSQNEEILAIVIQNLNTSIQQLYYEQQGNGIWRALLD